MLRVLCVCCWWLLGAVVLGATASLELPSEHTTLESPNGRLSLWFGVNGRGEPLYSVSYDGEPLIEASRLGLEPTGLDRFTLVSTERTELDTEWTNPFGELRQTPDRYRAASFLLHGKAGRQLRIEFRVYDEGAAFRYVMPGSEAQRHFIEGERSEFRLPPGVRAYDEYGTEGEYRLTPVADIRKDCERPLTLVYQSGVHAAICEAANLNYARMLVSPLEGASDALVSSLGGGTSNDSKPHQASDSRVSLRGGEASPWRVVLVGGTPGALLENNYLLLNLSPPCALSDTSWIKPGKAMRDAMLTTKNAKAVIDFADAAGLSYVHFDAGWYGAETDEDSDATTVSVQGLDLQQVIKYGDAKGVGVLVYVNRRALEHQLDEILPLYEEWGLRGVKYGFVRVGPQSETSWLTGSLRRAADHRLMINVHDGYRANGVNRTFPNLMTVEGIRGNEHMPTAEHNCTLPFTRYLCGIGDYAICYYDDRIQTTHAHQLALSVVCFSPLQWVFWYDTPDRYQNEPEIEFIREVPTVWDETRVLEGAIGEYATIARRSGDAWFIGAINANAPREVSLPLNFLSEGAEYIASTYYDSPKVKTRTQVGVRRQKVTSKDACSFKLAPSGGAAVWIRPAKESR